MDKNSTYAEAMQRLEKIVQEIGTQSIDIDRLSDQIKEANQLIAYCKKKLTRVDKEVQRLLNPPEEEEA